MYSQRKTLQMTEHPLIAILAIVLIVIICIRRNLIAHKREMQSTEIETWIADRVTASRETT